MSFRVYEEPDKEVETSDLISISDDFSDDAARVVSVIPKDDILQVILILGMIIISWPFLIKTSDILWKNNLIYPAIS